MYTKGYCQIQYIMFHLIIIILIFIFLIFDNKHKVTIPYESYTIKRNFDVGYDFDDCLRDFKTKEDIYPIVQQMINDVKNDKKVCIITARGKAGEDEIIYFLKKYNLNVDKVPIYTTGSYINKNKSFTINNIGVKKFYDDNPIFLNDIKQNSPSVELYKVHHNEPKKENDFSIDSITTRIN